MSDILFGPWDDEFNQLLDKSSRVVRIISPFVSSDGIIPITKKLEKGTAVYLITRLNDRDFLSGASSIEALVKIVQSAGKICAQSARLHAKLYIFDAFSAIVTSSNLTKFGRVSNLEVGVCFSESEKIQNLVEYFDNLWEKLQPDLNTKILQEISDHIAELKLMTKGNREEPPGVRDHGKDIIFHKKPTSPPMIPRKKDLQKGQKRYWIKFSWRRDSEADFHESIHTYITHCAITFPAHPGRPRQISRGDVIYHAALTSSYRGRDWIIFGKGEVAIEHRQGIDELPEKIRRDHPDLGRYPYLIWLCNVDIIGADLSNGISLHEIFDELEEGTFIWSQQESIQGHQGRYKEAIRYYRSHIELTSKAADLIDNKLIQVFSAVGKISYASGEEVWWNKFILDTKFKFKKAPTISSSP